MKKIISVLVIIAILVIGGGLAARSTLFPVKDKDIIQKYAKEYNIEASLIASFINFETGFSPLPYTDNNSVGYMKIKAATAESLAQEMKIENFDKTTISNNDTNIEMGTYYLSKFKDGGIEEMVGKWGIKNGQDANEEFDAENYYKTYHVEKIEKLNKFYKILYPNLNN